MEGKGSMEPMAPVQLRDIVPEVSPTGWVFLFVNIARLSLFIGQVIYIAILKAEVGSKLVPISLLSPPRLTYQYGWSFLLLVISFLSCEAAGVSSIFLYMHHHQYRYLCRQDESRIGVHLLKNLAAPLTGADQLTTNGDIIREAINKAEDELEQQEEHEDTRDMSRFMDHKHIPTMTVAEANKRRDSAENNPVWAVGNGRLKGAQGVTKSLAVVDPFQAGVFPPEKTTRLVSHPWNQAHFHPRLNGQLKSSSGSPPKRRADMFLCARHRAASLRRHNRRVDHESNLFECQALPKQSRHHHPSHQAAQYPRISDGNSSQEDDEDEDDRSEITADGDDEDSFRALLHQERRNNGMLSADRHQPNSHVLSSRNPPHITMDSFTNPSFFQPHLDSSRAHSAPSPFCPASHHHPTLPNSVPRPATVAEGLPEFHQCCQCVHCGFTLTNEGPSSSKSHHAAGCRGVSVGVGVGDPDPDSFLSRASVMHSLVGPRKCLCEDSAHHSASVTSHHNLMQSPPLPHYPSDCGLYETGVGDPFFLDQDTRV
ncbi:hypothetical protein TCAL_16504 [Tigriopus californicus]|uniref:Uncharacterized protein n=1 Tax=Tigriopus californicus TaxID=6832 RepID=A0A553NUC7_TIGCA|nr:hypothetical protein TCAL_16504 [Tigriopus californicus]